MTLAVDRPLRILLSIHHRLDRDSGAAGVVMRFAEEYRRRGHDARIASHDDLPRWMPPSLRQLAFPALLDRLCGTWRPDVVDASSGDGWLRFGRAGAGGALRVTHSHGLEHLSSAREIAEDARLGRPTPWRKRAWRHGARLRLVARSFRAADLGLVLNDAEAAFLNRRLGIPPGRVRRIRLGTDHAGRDPAPGPPRDPGAVVQIGAYVPRKGVATTAAAMVPLLRARPAATLTFVGTGVPRERVLGDYPPDVHRAIAVAPRYDNRALPALLAQSAICLMPSSFEGYGVAKLEAMACGVVPVVSDDPGACADIDDGIDGVVVPRGDATALAGAVLGLVDQPLRRAALASAGLAKAARFSWPAVAAERIACYVEAAGRTARRSGAG